MEIKDLWERCESGFLRWNYGVSRPDIKDLPEEGFLGLAKKVILEDLNKNMKKSNIPWASDFSYSTNIKNYIIDIEYKRAAWVISSPRPEDYTPLGSSSRVITLFPKRYVLKFFKEGKLPIIISNSNDPLYSMSLGERTIDICEQIAPGDYIGFSLKIPENY